MARRAEAQPAPSPGERPFCEGDEASRVAFDAWVRRLGELGFEVGEADRRIVGLIASREVRLEQLSRAVAGEQDGSMQLRLVQAERLAAQDVAASLELLERTFGVAADAATREQPRPVAVPDGARPGRVVPFVGSASTKAGQRIAAACRAAGRPLTLADLRRLVPGGEGDFRRGLRDALQAGAVAREGLGKRGRPYLYTAAR